MRWFTYIQKFWYQFKLVLFTKTPNELEQHICLTKEFLFDKLMQKFNSILLTFFDKTNYLYFLFSLCRFVLFHYFSTLKIPYQFRYMIFATLKAIIYEYVVVNNATSPIANSKFQQQFFHTNQISRQLSE